MRKEDQLTFLRKRVQQETRLPVRNVSLRTNTVYVGVNEYVNKELIREVMSTFLSIEALRDKNKLKPLLLQELIELQSLGLGNIEGLVWMNVAKKLASNLLAERGMDESSDIWHFISQGIVVASKYLDRNNPLKVVDDENSFREYKDEFRLDEVSERPFVLMTVCPAQGVVKDCIEAATVSFDELHQEHPDLFPSDSSIRA